MTKDPAFLLYSADFLTGVSDLTFEERGQYITLLCMQHQKGRLSGKAVAIAVPNAAADVMAKFRQDENGFFYNERLEEETAKRRAHAEKQRDRALKGWEKRRKSDQTSGKAVADAAALPLENVNVNEDESINVEFSAFWDLYAKKRGDKARIEKKWNKLTDLEREAIMNNLPDYIKATPDKQFRKDPETYLNQRGWEHEVILPPEAGWDINKEDQSNFDS